MVGPCCWDPPADPPSWLSELERPLVLISTSSEFQADGRLVNTALEPLAHEDVNVVATVPAHLPATAVPANARLEPFLSHAPLLARAACAVTHGGAGVTQKALAAGVPVCVVPFGRDQLEVARRVEGRRHRHTTTGAAAKPGPAARQDPRSDDQDPRRASRRRRLCCRRRTRRRRRRLRDPDSYGWDRIRRRCWASAASPGMSCMARAVARRPVRSAWSRIGLPDGRGKNVDSAAVAEHDA
jgi:hypothetical protein